MSSLYIDARHGENVHLLDNRALNLLDLVFAELAKLSVH